MTKKIKIKKTSVRFELSTYGSLARYHNHYTKEPTMSTGRAQLIQSHSSARFSFELSGNSN